MVTDKQKGRHRINAMVYRLFCDVSDQMPACFITEQTLQSSLQSGTFSTYPGLSDKGLKFNTSLVSVGTSSPQETKS